MNFHSIGPFGLKDHKNYVAPQNSLFHTLHIDSPRLRMAKWLKKQLLPDSILNHIHSI